MGVSGKPYGVWRGMQLRERNWYCPAVDRDIDEGLCGEYRLAGHGSPEATLRELERWMQLTRRYAGIDEFHAVCAGCAHCQGI